MMHQIFVFRRLASLAFFWVLVIAAGRASGAFLLDISIGNPHDFTPLQLQITQTALDEAKALWERKITGYQPGINQSVLPISVFGNNAGFASALVTGSTFEGGFWVSTGGQIFGNTGILEEFSQYGPNRINVIDELMAHEIGHVLGIGTQWISNGVYVWGSGRYTGAFGVAAYQREFDPLGLHIPVELAGNPGTPNAHWNQRMRSSSQEGNPSDPFSLDPRIGIVDRFGRDLALELMTGAIDPDYGEPFLSKMTVQSLRDLGFTVVPEPISMALVLVAMMGRAKRL